MQFNQFQKEAIESTQPNIVVTAAPGSGKTRVIVGAIDYYKQRNPSAKVVAITFTKKAAAELNLKLYEHPDVHTATIHSWSLRELKALGAKYKFEVELLRDEQVTEILKFVCKKCGYYSLNMYLLYSYVMGNYNIDVSTGIKMKFEKVLRTYTQYKRDNQMYDFTDLPLYLYDMLNRYHERIRNIDALFVDEFQDVDKTQAKIFDMVDASKKFYVGDPWQSIYVFRGADASVLKDLEGFTSYTLSDNYRSYQSILDFATAARDYEDINELNSVVPSWINAARKEERGNVFMITRFEEGLDFSAGPDRVVERNPYSILSSFLESRPYILCRSNQQVKELQKLGYKNCSTVHQAKGLEYPNVIVVSFLTENEEEVNVMYVACTRAQNGLLVCDWQYLVQYMTENQVDLEVPDLF